MLAYAYGPTGVRRVIEATLAKTDTTEIERGYTGQRGQDEQNRRARKAAVQTPGKALTPNRALVLAPDNDHDDTDNATRSAWHRPAGPAARAARSGGAARSAALS